MSGKIALVLSGTGVYDGSEVHESSAACVAITRAGKEVAFYAPDKDQHHVINHVSGEADEGATRNVVIESGRIARGKVNSLAELTTDAVDAVIFPGGFGAAKNLSTFATSSDPEVDPEVSRVLREFHAAGKPIGLCCIAPIVAALVLSKQEGIKVKMTLGKSSGVGWPYAATIAKAVEFGVDHVEASVAEICVDEENKIVTSPAFMYDGAFHEIFEGVTKMVDATLGLI